LYYYEESRIMIFCTLIMPKGIQFNPNDAMDMVMDACQEIEIKTEGMFPIAGVQADRVPSSIDKGTKAYEELEEFAIQPFLSMIVDGMIPEMTLEKAKEIMPAYAGELDFMKALRDNNVTLSTPSSIN